MKGHLPELAFQVMRQFETDPRQTLFFYNLLRHVFLLCRHVPGVFSLSDWSAILAITPGVIPGITPGVIRFRVYPIRFVLEYRHCALHALHCPGNYRHWMISPFEFCLSVHDHNSFFGFRFLCVCVYVITYAPLFYMSRALSGCQNLFYTSVHCGESIHHHWVPGAMGRKYPVSSWRVRSCVISFENLNYNGLRIPGSVVLRGISWRGCIVFNGLQGIAHFFLKAIFWTPQTIDTVGRNKNITHYARIGV